MTVTAFRVQNFMGFEDSGWIELRPIILLFGRNSSGKSALIRALLLLRQSLDSSPDSGALLFVKDDGYDFGDYREIVRDHGIDSDISFWFRIRFRKRGEVEPDDDSLLRAWDAINDFTVGRSAPVDTKLEDHILSIRLIIGQGRDSVPILKALDIYAQQGDIILSATRQNQSHHDAAPWTFSSELFDTSSQDDTSQFPDLWQYTEIFTQNGFLPWIRPLENTFRQIEEEAGDDAAAQLGDDFQNVWLTLRGIRRSLLLFLEKFDYLGPMRAAPQRFYYVAGQGSGTPERGRQFVRSLVKANPASLLAINTWLATAGFSYRADLQPLDERKTLYELRLQEVLDEQKAGVSANIREVGFGLTQMLPIIAQAVLAKPGDTLIIEQPELHLHPRAQAELADLFIAMARNGTRFLIETHSEHLLLRLRRRIAESSSAIISPNDLCYLRAHDLRACFIDRTEGRSSVETIQIDEKGKMSSPPGFRGFFADDLHELAMLNQAILGSNSGV
jgi:energy-coupling factor transporter ATP-binding protein EcfA2